MARSSDTRCSTRSCSTADIPASSSSATVVTSSCASSAGGSPDTSGTAALLDSTALQAALLIAPDTLSMSADSGWTTITVTITNATQSPGLVWVPLYPSDVPGDSLPITIVNYHTTPGWTGGPYQYQMDYYMTVAPAGTAGSTRREVFDEQIPARGWASRYVVTGLFAESRTPAQVLTVAP